jgi:predicted SnoaL-like aldol condensation-catalyzing enzyme
MRFPLLTLPLLLACARNVPSSAMSLSPRDKVVRLLEVGIGTANPDAIRELLGTTYTQHNPRVPDGPGGLVGFVEEFREWPEEARPKVKVIRTLVDGEFVVAHTRYRRKSWVSAFDLFRLRDGKLVEHWDAGQQEPESTASGHSMVEGPVEITDLQHTEANKALVRHFVEAVLIRRELGSLPEYFAGDAYVEHDPLRTDGLAALQGALQAVDSADTALLHQEVRRVVGEGNFVLAQSRGTKGGALAVIYDLFRVAGGKLCEHWLVFERVPAKADNDNGMF